MSITNKIVLGVIYTVGFAAVAVVLYVKVNTHDPAPAFPQEIVEIRANYFNK